MKFEKPACKYSGSGTHFELGFSVNASITLGRKVREQKGAWVRALERFNIVVTKAAAIKSAAQLLKETYLGGGGMKNHGNQQTAAGWTIGVSVLKAGTGR